MPDISNEVLDVEELSVEESSELVTVTESSEEELGITEALGISGLGFGIVFTVLVVLMAFITVMSMALRGGKKESKPAVKSEPKAAPKAGEAPKAVEAPAVKGDADMYVSLNGVRHAVSVEEKVPRFTVTVNGKSHGVDVEEAKEDEE